MVHIDFDEEGNRAIAKARGALMLTLLDCQFEQFGYNKEQPHYMLVRDEMAAILEAATVKLGVDDAYQMALKLKGISDE